MKNLNTFDVLAAVVLIVGGINWGMIGLFGVDIIGAIFGTMSTAARIIYILVGISAVYIAVISSRLEEKVCTHAPYAHNIIE